MDDKTGNFFYVNSFHAIDASTGEVIPHDKNGFIDPPEGTTIVFENPHMESDEHYITVHAMEFNVKPSYSDRDDTLIAINGNEVRDFYPLIINGATKIDPRVKIYRMKIIRQGSPFYFQALSSAA